MRRKPDTMGNASPSTLLRRHLYGGRKGRRAWLRLLQLPPYKGDHEMRLVFVGPADESP